MEDLGASLYNQQRMLADGLKRLSSTDRKVQDYRNQGISCEEDMLKANEELEKAKRLQRGKEDILGELRKEEARLSERVLRMSQYNAAKSSEALVNQRSALKTDENISTLEQERDGQDREIVWLEEQIARAKKETLRMHNRTLTFEEEHKNKIELIKQAQRSLAQDESDRRKILGDMNSVNQTLLRRKIAISESLRAVQQNLSMSREYETEASQLKKRIEKESTLCDKLIGDWFQRGEVAKSLLVNRLESESKVKSDIISKLTALQESLDKAYEECEDSRKELRQEKKREESMLRAVYLAQTKLQNLRETSLSAIGGKNAANAAFSDIMKEYKSLSKYEKEREVELKRVLVEVNQITTERESTQLAAREVEAKLQEAKARLNENEALLTVMTCENTKLQRQLESRSRQLDQIKQRIDTKSQRNKEAELSQTSSELSLSLVGKVKAVETEIASTLEECGNLERNWLKQQQCILIEESEKDSEKVTLSKSKTVLVILENKRKRKLSELNDMQIELKRRKNEILKLKLDLDKLGGLILRFDDKIGVLSDLAAKIEDSVHEVHTKKGQISRLDDLNTNLRNEVVALVVSLEQIEKDRLGTEQKLEIEEQVQCSLMDEPENWKEIEKVTNRMRTELIDLNKRKETLSKSLVQLIGKRDSIEIKHHESSRNSSIRRQSSGFLSRSLGHLSSCSTTSSLTSLVNPDRRTGSIKERIESVKQETRRIDDTLSQIAEKRRIVSDLILVSQRDISVLENRGKSNAVDFAACTLRVHALESMCKSIDYLLDSSSYENSCMENDLEKQLIQRELNCWNHAVRSLKNPEWDPIKEELIKWISFNSNLLHC